MSILTKDFFDRDTVTVARELIGARLVRNVDGRNESLAITETEAYDGPNDLACHASKGKTARTQVLFGPPGTIYVYFVYGMHNMLNIVTGPEEYPAAVLIRGVEGISGPGRLTKALGITRELNDLPLGKTAGLWIEEGKSVPDASVERTARIGVEYAGPIWSKKPYRFILHR